jgi:hypothetical protein
MSEKVIYFDLKSFNQVLRLPEQEPSEIIFNSALGLGSQLYPYKLPPSKVPEPFSVYPAELQEQYLVLWSQGLPNDPDNVSSCIVHSA